MTSLSAKVFTCAAAHVTMTSYSPMYPRHQHSVSSSRRRIGVAFVTTPMRMRKQVLQPSYQGAHQARPPKLARFQHFQ